MNTKRNLLLFFLLSSWLLGAEVKPSITAEELSRLFQISGKIVVSDKSEELSAKYGDAIISALLFEPDDDGFSRIQALTTKGGFLLNDSRRGKLEQSAPAVEKLQLKNGAVGYVGLEGAGPGGEGYIAIAHVPEKNIDVQFKVIIRNEGASPDSSEEVAKYHHILRNGSELQKALNAVLAQGVSNVAKSDDRAVEPAQRHSHAPAKAEKEVAVVERAMDATKPLPSSTEAEFTTSGIWWNIGALVALLALLTVWLKKRKS